MTIGLPTSDAASGLCATDHRIPVTLITGFLGSGKTTLLNRLLRDPALADSAVIINEFGEIGIDHLLVATPAENMVLLDTGCLCCTVRGDLVQTLGDLFAKRESGAIRAFSRVIIETTGLADPVPVVQTVVADGDLGRVYRLCDIVTLVDAVHGEAQLDTHRESVKQAALADALLVSKSDLATREQTNALRRRLERINPGAEIHEIRRGEIEPAVFLKSSRADAARALDLDRWQADGPGEHGHAATTRHESLIRSFCLYRERPIRRAGLMMWLDMLSSLRGANLLRVKGLLNVEGEAVLVQAVQSVVHEPTLLEAWPSDDRRSRLVFIVRDMDRDALERTFDAFDYAPQALETRRIDPRAYADFVQAMNGFAARAPAASVGETKADISGDAC